LTGGSGFFGRAAARHLALRDDVRKVRIFNRCEARQARFAEELEADRSIDNDKVIFILGDVRDAERVRRACRGVDYVLHAAALKRIEKVQADVREAIHTNVLGSLNVAEAAEAEGCKAAVLLSSDKAAGAPANAYGATKLLSEHLFASIGRAWGASKTRLVAVRYGNVWASTESVAVRWKRAIQEGRPVIVNHPDATRFFWSKDQAVAVAVWAAEQAPAGHLVVPSMRAARMGDFAEATGGVVKRGELHDAEKMHETLLTADELRRSRVEWGGPMKLWLVPPVTGKGRYSGALEEKPADDLTSENAERLTTNELALAFAGAQGSRGGEMIEGGLIDA
jgi:UDP-N-acetylglucosamine 4,6-dehydratase